MKLRGLIAAAVVLAVLAAALYWSDKRKPVDDAAKAAADAPVKILSPNRDDISKVEIVKKSGDDVVLTKTGADIWKITAPKELLADQDQVLTVLSALSPVTSDHVIEDKATDLKAYGLADPALKVSVTTKDKQPLNLLIGDDTPTGGSAYAKLEGDPRVLTVATSTKTSLDKGTKDLRDKRLLPVDYDKIKQVNVTSPKLSLSFGSDNGQWVIQSPKDVRGDVSKLEGLVEKLKVATMDPNTSVADAKKAASSFSSGTQVATVKAADTAGTQELQIRKDKDAYYVKTTAMEGAFKVPNDLGEAINNKTLDDFREMRLFDFASETPEKLELHLTGKSYLLTRTGDDWFSDGKKMDFMSVDSVIRSIRLLVGTKFVKVGFSNPATTLTVTSKDGKLVEKALISKVGDHYIGKRDSEPLLYELDSKVVEDLQKSAQEMKPADITPVAPAKQ